MANTTAYIKTNTVGREVPNFLSSEEGLVLKTYQLNKADYSSNPVVKAGTVITITKVVSEQSTTVPIGILFVDVDLTDGDRFVPLMVAGRVYENRLPTGYASYKTALQGQGLYFDTMPETTRPD